MNGRRRFLTASVISVQNSNFVYPSCQNCFSRLHVDLERYSCLKCGCSGDARETNYRYRLSLQVTNAHEVFLVTVFGSCLETFFGVTAESLHRYIEDLNLEVGEAAAREESPSVVIQAVKACFIGKKFIFGVKDSEKQDGAGCLQNGSRVGCCPKALTACQMFVPNPGLVGCTVLCYLLRHQCPFGSKGSHGDGWSPGGLFTALDQPCSELSSLHGSGDWDVVPSSHAPCPASPWPQSFGLTSSSLSGGTAAESAAFDPSRTACDEQKWNDSAVSPQHHNRSVDNSQENNLSGNERNVEEGDKFRLFSWRDSIFVTKDAQGHSSERKDYRSLRSPLETGLKDSPGKISIRLSRGLEKSQNPLQGYSSCPLSSCAGHSRGGRSSQDDPWFWDELPSSESLNEFIVRIENSHAVVSPTETRAQGHFPRKGTGESHGRVNPSPLQLEGTSTTGPAHEKPQEVAEKADASHTPLPSCLYSNHLSGKENQQGASSSSSSAQGKDEWECLSSSHQTLLPQLSPVGMKPSLKGGCQSSREGADITGLETHRAASSLKSDSDRLESPARLNCKCENNGWRKKASSCCEPKQTACEKQDRVCEGQPLPEVQENHGEGGDISNLLQDSSICPQGSYNASADLFDVSAAGAEVVVEMLSATQGGALTTKSMASGHKSSESEAGWNTSQNELSFLDRFAAPDLKASPLVARSAVESEHSPLGTQDFVPSSQSTPCVRPCQQARLPRGKESILSELPLNKLPWIDAKWKGPRPAFKGPLVKRLVSKFLQSRRSSNMSSGATDTSMTQGLSINDSPAQKLSESGGEEWIPPTEKKLRPPLHFQNQKNFGSRRKRSWVIVEKKTPFSETQARWEIPRGTVGSARTEFAPKIQRPTEATVREDTADPEQVRVASPGFCTFPDGSRLNPYSTPHSTPDTVNWSPELF